MSATGAIFAGVWIAYMNPANESAPDLGAAGARVAHNTGSDNVEAPAPRDSAAVIEIVRVAGGTGATERKTTLGDMSRYAIGDDELIELLAAIGRPTGIARIGGRTMLTAAVTDEELAAERREKEVES